MGEFKFNFGDYATLAADVPHRRAGEEVAICGRRVLDRPGAISGIECRNGEHVYLIEFPDGEAIEIPERLLVAQ